MRNIAIVFLVLALGCDVFAYWGLSTVSGRSAFDEMGGMIPLELGVVGVLFAIGSLITWWRYYRKHWRNARVEEHSRRRVRLDSGIRRFDPYLPSQIMSLESPAYRCRDYEREPNRSALGTL